MIINNFIYRKDLSQHARPQVPTTLVLNRRLNKSDLKNSSIDSNAPMRTLNFTPEISSKLSQY